MSKDSIAKLLVVNIFFVNIDYLMSIFIIRNEVFTSAD